jgi:hypothetical protein
MDPESPGTAWECISSIREAGRLVSSPQLLVADTANLDIEWMWRALRQHSSGYVDVHIVKSAAISVDFLGSSFRSHLSQITAHTYTCTHTHTHMFTHTHTHTHILTHNTHTHTHTHTHCLMRWYWDTCSEGHLFQCFLHLTMSTDHLRDFRKHRLLRTTPDLQNHNTIGKSPHPSVT